MQFSLNQIREWASLSPSVFPDEVIFQILNELGFTVKSALPFSETKNVFVGTVEGIKSHPKNDHLQVLQVNLGKKQLQIVTSATNVFLKNQVIVLDETSSVGNLRIKSLKINGVLSQGVIASLEALGVSRHVIAKKTFGKALVYKTSVKPGSDATKKLGLEDVILTTEVLPNRADAASYLTICTELSARLKTKCLFPTFKKVNCKVKTKLKVLPGKHNAFTLFDADNPLESSCWKEQLLLMKSGIKPECRAVDLTNLALIMFGQAVNVYDKTKVGENFFTTFKNGVVKVLGHRNVSLNQALCVLSNNKIVSLAGVITLESAKVSQKTKKVVFEIANFDPVYVRKTTKNLKIYNHTTVRTSNSSSLGLIAPTINFLQNALQGCSNVVNFYNHKTQPITVSETKLNEYAGFHITRCNEYTKTLDFLRLLGFNIVKKYTFYAPFYRYDIQDQYDLIEEIFRAYGYKNIPDVACQGFPSFISRASYLKDALASKNYSEIYTYSLQPYDYNKTSPFKQFKQLSVKSFHSKKRSVYRGFLTKAVLEICLFNQKQNLGPFSFFETAYANGDHNNFHLCLATNTKTLKELKNDFLTIIKTCSVVTFRKTTNSLLSPNASADVYLDKEHIGFIGYVNPKLTPVPFRVAEVKLPKWVHLKKVVSFEKTPLKTKDWTITVPKEQSVDKQVREVCQKIKVWTVEHVKTYFPNSKSKAVTFRFYLGDSEVKQFMQITKQFF